MWETHHSSKSSKSKSTALFLASWKKTPDFTLIEEPKWNQHFGGFPMDSPTQLRTYHIDVVTGVQLFTCEAATIRQQHQAAVGYGIRHQGFSCESFAVDWMVGGWFFKSKYMFSHLLQVPHVSAKKGMAEKRDPSSLIKFQVLQFLLMV